MIIAIDSEILFQCLVGSFRLTVTFGMISGSEVEFHVQSFSERLEEVGHEFRTSVGGNVRRDSMFGKDVEDEELSELSRSDSIVSRDEYSLLGKSVHYN